MGIKFSLNPEKEKKIPEEFKDLAKDFADKGLTEKVVADFKNNRNSPEFDRLQEMAKRRQSYLTSNAPSGGGANAPKSTRKSASEAQFDRLADRAMKNRIG